ncbi:switch 2-like [Silene latifolia]|uniref:switch 2-like n=1 Tax=Silene latifolia TaxID=37657 RepID=UPI003D777C32
MSFKAFKDTLKPCTTTSTTSSSSSSSSTISQFNPNPIHPRRIPPKTSISQQLLRLDHSLSQQTKLSDKQPPITKEKEKEKEKVKEDNEDYRGFGRPNLDVFSFGETGPFQPLLLSSPGVLPLVQVPASINCRLLQHQREGVKFLYQLYKNNHGGILGDDMGLGKTIQTIAFLAAVFAKDTESANPATVKRNQQGPVLIIGPASVLQNWEDEFSNWSTFRVSIYHGPNRDLILNKVEGQELEVMITSFDTFRIYGTTVSEVMWDIVIVDEAHRLKNERSKLYIACLGFKTKRRYGLTGTVMQNKIMELFNLFDWVAPGSLGSREHFRDFYDEPLKLGQRSSAPELFIQVAEERKKHLTTLLSKYLLRRTKEETVGNLMLGKEDNIVFCEMSEPQKRAYQRMLQQPEIRCLINKDLPCSCGSPLSQGECHNRTVPDGVIWRYLHRDNPEGCDWCPGCLIFPCILKLQQISNHVELIKPNPKDDEDKQKKDAELAENVFGPDIDLVGGKTQNESFMGLSDVKHCGKMKALERLMTSWISHGDKVLLFSHSVRMLDILEKFMMRKGYFYTRLDGSTPTGVRQSLVNDFNSSPSMQVFLISTRAGGLGLNLVSANRVVIFDPSWNPSHDLQAQDRSFRLGQKRHVVVFRLIAAGSLEELVYTRQVYKQQLSNIAVSGKLEKRYFEGVQDHKQFQGELFGICNLFRDLSDKLFTSDIIGLHDKHAPEPVGGEKQNVNNIGVHLVQSKEATKSSFSESNVTEPSSSLSTAVNKPLLKELGILYSHRFEDIVNFGPEKTVIMAEKAASNGDTKELHNYPLTEAKLLNDVAETKPMSRENKKRQFSLVAQWMGMTELEFSKWVISASPRDREKTLRDYKKRRKETTSRA